jgi:hypothetical protein
MSQQTSQQHSRGPQSGFTLQNQGVLDKIASSDLDPGSKRLLENLLSTDLVFSNLNDAEVQDFRFRLEEKRELFFAMHPGDECLVTGLDRAEIYDDAADTLKPLSDEEKHIANDIFDFVQLRLMRSKGMEQQRVLKTNIQEQHLDRGEQDGTGLLSKLPGR